MAERHAPDIRIFVSCHKAFPIHVGAALADRPLDGYIRDDSGENISRLNRRYCELTGQYWAWKNEDAEYYGFFHYRRYLYPDTHCRRPYIIRSEPDGALLEKLGYGTFAGLIGQYQLIAPIGEDMHVSVREHYGAAPFHRAKDLELAERIVARRYPEYAEAMEHYLSGTICYWGNIYIMDRETFFDYCGWLFPILREFDETADLSGYSAQELRVDGGASANEFLMQFQADIIGKPVCRPVIRETTALGAAYLAGLAVQFWSGVEELKTLGKIEKTYQPQMDEATRARLLKGWHRAVERAKNWIDPEDEE